MTQVLLPKTADFSSRKLERSSYYFQTFNPVNLQSNTLTLTSAGNQVCSFIVPNTVWNSGRSVLEFTWVPVTGAGTGMFHVPAYYNSFINRISVSTVSSPAPIQQLDFVNYAQACLAPVLVSRQESLDAKPPVLLAATTGALRAGGTGSSPNAYSEAVTGSNVVVHTAGGLTPAAGYSFYFPCYGGTNKIWPATLAIQK